MSTGCECDFLEIEPGKWYYVLEDYNAPKNAWDWREYASAYGPFVSFDEAHKHLHDYHANPGGYSTQEYVEGFTPDKVLADLIANATNRRW